MQFTAILNVSSSTRANASYEQSDEEYDDDDEDEDEDEEDEDVEDEDDYEDPPPRRPEPPRPVSAQRRVEVQPGPSRVSAKVVEKVQRRAEAEDQVQEHREVSSLFYFVNFCYTTQRLIDIVSMVSGSMYRCGTILVYYKQPLYALFIL